jgi:stress response protein SCP2
MSLIQEHFNSILSGEFVLTPGEYEGPLVVNRACTIDGCRSTLWANNGPVLTIAAPNVTVKNLRIEVTGSQTDENARIAIKTNDPYTKLENVEVNGNVIGLSQESESWDLPGMISLGEFAANKENTFSVSLQVPSNATLDSKVKDLRISPTRLSVGQNSLTITTDELRNNTIIYGEIIIRTAVSRRIYVTGKAMKDAPVHNEALPVVNGPTVSLPVQIDPPAEVIAPQVSGSNVQAIKKGQRLSIKELQSSQIKILYEHHSATSNLDIDSYCFALRDNGKVSCDEDLIFFGNTEAYNHSIKTSTADGKPLVLIDLEKVDSAVSRIAVCYSIYGDESSQNFSKVISPMIRIFGGEKEVYRFELNDLTEEKTVVAAEIYRYKGEWKMNFVGAGYKSGLKQLCEGYGVNVE